MNIDAVSQPISEIGSAVRAEMESIREHHSCIWTSSVLTEVLHNKGYRFAYPLSVRVQILNPSFNAWAKQHGMPKDQASLEACEAAGGAIVGLGKGSKEDMPDGKWPGHVAVIIPKLFRDRHAMIDLTITQANKPDWQIKLQTLMAPVPQAFARGETEFKVEVNGCLIVYRAFPGDRDFETAPVWLDKKATEVIAERVLMRLASGVLYA